jgi:FkbM family methyltransferase
MSKIRAATLGLVTFLIAVLILARAAPAVPLRAYFAIERKLDLDILRDLEPAFIKIGILRPARLRVRGGWTMLLDPRDLVPLILLRTGEWQPEVWDSLVAVLPKDAVFLDVGAHIGVFTLKAARQVGPGGKAIAFEPNPETAVLLRDNISANHLNNVTVEEIACTNKEAQLTFYAAPINNTGASSLSQTNAAYGDAPRTFQVRGRPIDDVVRELKLDRVDAIKIDVEGAELLVLEGAAETLKRFHPKIVLEIVPAQLASFHTTPEEVASFIRSTGYTIGSPLTKDATDWQWTAVTHSTVAMSDLVAAPQLLRGFGGIEASTWRWTAKQFDIALRPPDGAESKGATLVGKFVFPGVAVQQLKQVQLSARIGGVDLPSATFSTEGTHEYRAEIPARLLQNNPTEINFSLDKSLTENLGLIAVSIGFEPR